MKRITAGLIASVFAVSMTVPARANDELLRLGIGIGLGVIGEVVKNRQGSQPKQQRQQAQPQKTDPRNSSGNQSAPKAVQAAPKPKRVPDEKVMYVQQRLNELGYTEVGGADGFWGSNTTKTVAIFQKDNGLTGEPKADDALIAALKTAKSRSVLMTEAEEAKRETALPPEKVEDGIVASEPQLTDEEKAYVEAVGDEGPVVTDETQLKPVVETAAAEPKETEVAKPAPVVVEAPQPMPVEAVKPVEVAPEVKDVAVAAPESVAPKQEMTDVQKVAEPDVQEINGMTISGDF